MRQQTTGTTDRHPYLITSTRFCYAHHFIRARIQSALDSKISPTQCSCRPNKSTAYAAYLIRRLQEWFEQRGFELHLAFLDSETAFHRVQHSRLVDASGTLSPQLRTTAKP